MKNPHILVITIFFLGFLLMVGEQKSPQRITNTSNETHTPTIKDSPLTKNNHAIQKIPESYKHPNNISKNTRRKETLEYEINLGRRNLEYQLTALIIKNKHSPTY